MDPPADVKPSHIQDLRTQIIANGAILYPRMPNFNVAEIDVVVAKLPRSTPIETPSSEKSEIDRFVDVAGESNEGRHYAVLLARTGATCYMKVIIKGEPRETVEGALGLSEWMLERTELDIHAMVEQNGQPLRCAIM